MADDLFANKAAFLSVVADSAARVVSAAVTANPGLATNRWDLQRMIEETRAALIGDAIEEPAPAEPKPTPRVPIDRTVFPDHIVSLEDGKPYKSLKRHLTGRGLTPDEYREKWGLPSDYPMVCPSYSERRSELAKEQGLGKR